MQSLTIGRCVPAAWRSNAGGDADVFLLPKVREKAGPKLRAFIPADRLAICSDCSAGFELGGPCPACGSAEFALAASFRRPDPNASPLPWKSGRGPR